VTNIDEAVPKVENFLFEKQKWENNPENSLFVGRVDQNNRLFSLKVGNYEKPICFCPSLY